MVEFLDFNNRYSQLPDHMFSRVDPERTSSPQFLAFNHPLAEKLGYKGSLNQNELAAIFSGNSVPEGSTPIAQAYAGHQFGNFVPSLGDGRAVLLGDVADTKGKHWDIQLKGSGRTVFSRGGDGKAWLGPVLREYVVSEAMHHLGIPTTRALGAALTGDTIVRAEGGVPSAVIARVASSHIRVGTFQYFAARQDIGGLRALLDYAIERHYPHCSTPLEFLQAVIERQSLLVSKWLGVGFIHGVMNTDNTAISGETIDYGPCAFMDAYHPATVFSSIDRRGRYAYMSQADIIVWNIAQLASSLLVLESDQDQAIEAYTNAVHKMPDQIAADRLAVFSAKLGIAEPEQGDGHIVETFLQFMMNAQADFTNTFRDLASMQRPAFLAQFENGEEWYATWQSRLSAQSDAQALMRVSNPHYIPRNHKIEEMIQAALVGDMSKFSRMAEILDTPYRFQAGAEEYALPPTPEEEIEATFCGT